MPSARSAEKTSSVGSAVESAGFPGQIRVQHRLRIPLSPQALSDLLRRQPAGPEHLLEAGDERRIVPQHLLRLRRARHLRVGHRARASERESETALANGGTSVWTFEEFEEGQRQACGPWQYGSPDPRCPRSLTAGSYVVQRSHTSRQPPTA